MVRGNVFWGRDGWTEREGEDSGLEGHAAFQSGSGNIRRSGRLDNDSSRQSDYSVIFSRESLNQPNPSSIQCFPLTTTIQSHCHIVKNRSDSNSASQSISQSGSKVLLRQPLKSHYQIMAVPRATRQPLSASTPPHRQRQSCIQPLSPLTRIAVMVTALSDACSNHHHYRLSAHHSHYFYGRFSRWSA